MTSNERVRISDREKTIIDALTHPEYCGGITEVAKGIWLMREKIKYKKLQDYIKKHNKNVVAKRLGYILEIFDIKQLIANGSPTSRTSQAEKRSIFRRIQAFLRANHVF